ncbi:unnamed protein product [Rhizophagus irregularis]|nr:unnamed protein product [Rhizophagus irregularis]CAB5366218.1 unnamed protein product [Rhizophagus irregularis]
MILNERNEGRKIAHKKGTLIFNLFIAISVLAIHQMFVVYLTSLLSHYVKTIEPTSATAWVGSGICISNWAPNKLID